MKTTINIMLVAALALILTAPGCKILDEKTLDVILNSEACAGFSQNSVSENFEDVAVIDIQDELNDAIDNNGYSKSDVTDATIVGASVGVTSFTQAHDWIISGQIVVEYLIIDTSIPDTTVANQAILLNYTSQSVQAALGQKIPVPLTDNGVDVLQQALDQFLADAVLPPQKAVLRFTVQNGSARTPQDDPPSPSDPIVFDWMACINIHVVIPQSVEVPDPF